jgi:hypothetical protein
MTPRPIAFVVLAASLAGCGSPAGSNGGATSTTGRKVEPWENVANRLRKENDLSACKTALGQLNNELAERTDLPPVPALTDEAAKNLAALVPLSTDDIAEIRGASYSALDPAYVAECFHLRDAARSLDPSGLPPQDLVRLGFAWVCRQVYLQPWELEREGYIPAVPPSYVLLRGHGSGIERAYVFLALLQQFGVDGCFIGDAGQSSLKVVNQKSVLHRGPFWAVGARVGPDIFLFDPWTGEPFPAPDGKGVATLAQVKADPAKWKLPEAEVKASSIVLAVPLSALAPRMATLESKILADTGVRLAMDASALKNRFPPEAKFWNPAGDRFTYTRMLVAFLPTEEGGLDRAESQYRPHTLYRRSLIPKSLSTLPAGLNPAAAERLQMAILGVYGLSFFEPPTPRERIQRGQFQDAARYLMQKLDAFGYGQERLRAVDPADLAAWTEKANGAFEFLNSARYPTPGQTSPLPENDPGVMDARAKLDEFWRGTEPVWRVFVDRATASLGRAEAAYLLALAKHEEAERGQSRGSAVNAWRQAASSWNAYLEQEGENRIPARSVHAKALAARAKSFANPK